MDLLLTPWLASLPSSNKREILLVESILGLNLGSWGFVNYVSCVSILLAETSSPTVLRSLWGRPGMIGKMESSPEKFLNDFFFVISHQIPFSLYSLPCLGGLYGYSFLFVFSLYHLFLYLRECAHTIFQFSFCSTCIQLISVACFVVLSN